MTSERWQRVEELYHAAYATPLNQRAAFLAEACRGDQALRRQVESLLNESSQDGFLAADDPPATGRDRMVVAVSLNWLRSARAGCSHIGPKIRPGRSDAPPRDPTYDFTVANATRN